MRFTQTVPVGLILPPARLPQPLAAGQDRVRTDYEATSSRNAFLLLYGG
jgi:hypothetical protein